MPQIKVLATDMDGTFIPLAGNQHNHRDLKVLRGELARHSLELVYVTGRNYDLVLDAVQAHELPVPEWLICDVGTSIYRRPQNGRHEILTAYQAHLSRLIGTFTVTELARELAAVAGLQLQEPEKQGMFKLSYYCASNQLREVLEQASNRLVKVTAPYRIVDSIDPITGGGLVDFLPKGVSKAHALNWWVRHTDSADEMIVFAGDSGNDLAALTAGYKSIVVGNADASLAQQVASAHQSAGWDDRLFLAAKPATSGVLEGLQHFCKQQ